MAHACDKINVANVPVLVEYQPLPLTTAELRYTLSRYAVSGNGVPLGTIERVNDWSLSQRMWTAEAHVDLEGGGPHKRHRIKGLWRTRRWAATKLTIEIFAVQPQLAAAIKAAA